MLNYRPKMFKEASVSHASKKLIWIIVSFIVVFFVILILETIIPGIVSWGDMKEEMAKLSAEGFSGNEWELSMKASQIVSANPNIMVPTLLSTVFGTLASIVYCRCIELRPVRSMGAVKKHCLLNYIVGMVIGAVLMTAIVLMSKLTGTSRMTLCENIDYKILCLFFLGFFVQGMSEICERWAMVKILRERLTPPLVPDSAFGGLKPRRTFIGPRYQGGVSDHLPVVFIVYF